MHHLLIENPLLLLFLVAALGYMVGKIRLGGVSLGVAAVLFVGLAFGVIHPEFNVPQIIFQIGLVFFVYSIGLSSGPAFFESFQKNGWRDIAYVLVMLTSTLALAIGIHFLFGFEGGVTTGIYTGSTTNTTALASVIEMINTRDLGAQNVEQSVVGYTYSYPVGVIMVMVVLKLMERVLKVDYAKEKQQLKKDYFVGDSLTTRTIEVTRSPQSGITIRDFMRGKNWSVLFGRIKKGEEISLTNWDTLLENGDLVMAIGSEEDMAVVADELGMEVPDSFHHDRKRYDIRRIFVSNPDIVGKTIASLNLSEKYDAVITRIRRGDVDMLAMPETVLLLGDRIRFIARRSDLKELSRLFGDSYYESSRVNLFSFGLGIALGLLIGLIEIPLPNGLTFKLGYAGGPLVVGLILGALRRTGPVVWALPYGANITLQQIGLMLLLAVIGLQSGNSFVESLGDAAGLSIFAGGVLLTILSTAISLIIGYKLFKIPYTILLGMMSNQPAILDFSQEMTQNKIPLIGYTIMFPIAMVAKIMFAQLLFLLLM